MSGHVPDLTLFFTRYEQIAREADQVFEHIRNTFPKEVICKEGCSSCCHALFDLSLVEALYLNSMCNQHMPTGMERFELLNRADAVDRKLAKIKRQAFKEVKTGKDNNEILEEMATVSVPCPLLDKDNRCLLYKYRPITCRLYGVPISIGGKGHTCGKTGFEQGKQYPTVFLDKIQERLAILSAELAQYLNSTYSELASVYVPVSSALLIEYTADYLGIRDTAKDTQP